MQRTHMEKHFIQKKYTICIILIPPALSSRILEAEATFWWECVCLCASRFVISCVGLCLCDQFCKSGLSDADAMSAHGRAARLHRAPVRSSFSPSRWQNSWKTSAPFLGSLGLSPGAVLSLFHSSWGYAGASGHQT